MIGIAHVPNLLHNPLFQLEVTSPIPATHTRRQQTLQTRALNRFTARPVLWTAPEGFQKTRNQCNDAAFHAFGFVTEFSIKCPQDQPLHRRRKPSQRCMFQTIFYSDRGLNSLSRDHRDFSNRICFSESVESETSELPTTEAGTFATRLR